MLWKLDPHSTRAANSLRTLINLNKIQFGFIPGKGTVNTIFVVRRMQEKYQKLYMYFVDLEKAKKSDGVGLGKEGSIRANGSGSYELVPIMLQRPE